MSELQLKDLILREDENHIFINKPSGISTLEDRSSRSNILNMARKIIPGGQVCHRLDKDTSGILVIAKNSETYRHISNLFERRLVSKVYHAVVMGLHDFKSEKNIRPLMRTGRGRSRTSWKGKDSATIFNTLDTYRTCSLVECIPITGRTHQIRVHLQSLEAPIIGDQEYGGKDIYLSQLKKNYNLKKYTEELPLIKRMALHAFSIEFEDIDGNPFHVQAPYPKDFAVLLKSLRKYG